MPIVRQLLASDGTTHIEKISAEPHGRAWSVLHEARDWRCVLPGQGQVHWCSGPELVYVDALTAFRLDPGDAYQLRHERARSHHVLVSGAGQLAPSNHRAWLLQPRELFQVKRALAQLRRGETQGVARAGATARAALARAVPLRAEQASSLVLRARHCAASASFERVKVEELAEEVRCSPFHLTRLFRQALGASPHQYRLHLRLASALQRLEDPGTALAGLAFELGFSSQSHFGEAFRRWVGCTPGEARHALR